MLVHAVGQRLAAHAKRAAAGNFVPHRLPCSPAACGARRVPRSVYEHGRLPMGAAARIASINFAIAFASLIKGNRGPVIIVTAMAVPRGSHQPGQLSPGERLSPATNNDRPG